MKRLRPAGLSIDEWAREKGMKPELMFLAPNSEQEAMKMIREMLAGTH